MTNLQFQSLSVIRSKIEALSTFVPVKAASLSCCLLHLTTNYLQIISKNSSTSTSKYHSQRMLQDKRCISTMHIPIRVVKRRNQPLQVGHFLISNPSAPKTFFFAQKRTPKHRQLYVTPLPYPLYRVREAPSGLLAGRARKSSVRKNWYKKIRVTPGYPIGNKFKNRVPNHKTWK